MASSVTATLAAAIKPWEIATRHRGTRKCLCLLYIPGWLATCGPREDSGTVLQRFRISEDVLFKSERLFLRVCRTDLVVDMNELAQFDRCKDHCTMTSSRAFRGSH